MTVTEALVLYAERDPVPGVPRPGPHQLYRRPRLTIEERALGPLAAENVRVQMLLAGICGTDLHAVQSDPDSGYILGSSPLDIGTEGRVLGHEGVGRIVAVGERVDHLDPDDVVVFESILHCNRCEQCRRGDFNQCRNARLLGTQSDGLFATYVDLPAGLCHEAGDLAEHPRGFEAAACIEPAACAYVACSLCRVAPGDEVVVFGAGPIGVFAAMLCKTVFGARTVHVVDPREFRRNVAARWADQTYDINQFLTRDPVGPVDVVIEASGAIENVDRVFRHIAPNGRIGLLGRSGKPLTIEAVDHFITNNISIHGSRGNLGGAFSRILHLVRTQRLPLQHAVTSVVDGIQDLQKWLEDPALVLEENCKVLVRLVPSRQ